MYCSQLSVVTLHWDSWAGHFCSAHAAELWIAKEPKIVVKIEEDECRVVF